jgi:tRNA(fMet)-specific endonuclease VapC
MYILDTDTLSLLFENDPRVLARKDAVPSSEIAITIVTRVEILQGRFAFLLKAATGDELLRAQLWLDKSVQSLAQVETVFPIDRPAAFAFDRLLQRRKLRKIGRADLLIAAIALAHRDRLVSRNLRDFRLVPGLQVENWAD